MDYTVSHLHANCLHVSPCGRTRALSALQAVVAVAGPLYSPYVSAGIFTSLRGSILARMGREGTTRDQEPKIRSSYQSRRARCRIWGGERPWPPDANHDGLNDFPAHAYSGQGCPPPWRGEKAARRRYSRTTCCARIQRSVPWMGWMEGGNKRMGCHRWSVSSLDPCRAGGLPMRRRSSGGSR